MRAVVDLVVASNMTFLVCGRMLDEALRNVPQGQWMDFQRRMKARSRASARAKHGPLAAGVGRGGVTVRTARVSFLCVKPLGGEAAEVESSAPGSASVQTFVWEGAKQR